MIKKIDMVKSSVKADVLPNIYLLHGDLTDEEMNQLNNDKKVFLGGNYGPALLDFYNNKDYSKIKTKN